MNSKGWPEKISERQAPKDEAVILHLSINEKTDQHLGLGPNIAFRGGMKVGFFRPCGATMLIVFREF